MEMLKMPASPGFRTTDGRCTFRPGDAALPDAHRPGSAHESGPISIGVSALLEAALDHLGFGVMVVGDALSVVYANTVARRECARGDAMRIEGARLSLSASRQVEELLRALAAARRGRWSLVHLGRDDDRLSLAVLPLTNDTTDPDPHALVVFGVRGHSRDLALEFYARSRGLTLAETRVLRALADGMNVREIAHEHQVKVTTVRTQVSSIRDRTQTRSVVDLVRTLSTLPPITPARAVHD